uniref:WD_REPEATS_REGION domain-containing protein n=2 Tax=Macrostomum lignano TaxID=282301 RepID=A0A1I8I6M9_9PLAT
MSKRNVSNIENVPAPAGPSAKAPRIASGGNSMSEYERARLQRINENQALLGNLNIALPRFKPTPAPVKLRVRPLPTTTSSTSNVGIDEEYQPPSAKQPRRASVRRAPKRRSARIAAADRIKRASTNSLDGDVLLPPSPKRRSRRIGAMAPNSAALGETASTSDSADEAESESDDEPERGRLDLASELADLLAQVKPFSSDNDEEDKNKAKNKTHANGFTTNNMRFLCSMRPLQKRIFSLALRDDGTAQQPLLGAAGDTKGTIGLFALTNNNESDAVLT